MIPAGATCQCIIAYLEELVENDGNAVTIYGRNPDPDDNGMPDRAIECCGDFTDWKESTYRGDTLHAALAEAVTAKRAFKNRILGKK